MKLFIPQAKFKSLHQEFLSPAWPARCYQILAALTDSFLIAQYAVLASVHLARVDMAGERLKGKQV